MAALVEVTAALRAMLVKVKVVMVVVSRLISPYEKTFADFARRPRIRRSR